MHTTLKKIATSLTLAFALATGAQGVGAQAAPKVGAKMADGTVYAGVSGKSNTSIYTTPENAPGLYKWEDAKAYCGKLNAFGRTDWRVPTKDELDTLYSNKGAGSLKGTFSLVGSNPPGFYWSSMPYENDYYELAWGRQLDHSGGKYGGFQDHASSVRCVR